jgi:penicillin-binding protein 1A
MAGRRRKGDRGSRRGKSASNLEFGLDDDDRATPTGRGRSRGRNAPSRRTRGGRRRGGGGLTGMLGRFGGRVLRVCAIVMLVGGVGVAGIVGYYATKLPPMTEWEVPPRPATVRILAENGALITTRGEKNGEVLTLDDMPAYLPQAVIAIEDRRFYWHYGIDPLGLVRAFFANWQAGGVVQGGSTLTQQLAKNLFLKPERTMERKIQEVILAVWLEAKLSKRRILELYLNRVYLGGGAYGVDAAALRYFGKSARDVTLAEAAMLAGLLKAPARYAPTTNLAAAEARAALVLTAMHSQGYIDAREASLAMSDATHPVGDVAGGSGRYVADWVIDLLSGYVGNLDGDVVVDTTIDLRLQAAAAHAVSDTLKEDGEKYRVGQGALVAMDSTGAVKALVGGSNYASAPFNRAVDARRQPGSAFKPFVYLTALEYGLTPETVRIDQPVSIGGWQPKNYTDEYRGPVTLQTALAFSLNTVSAQLTAEVGPSNVAATAHRLGITSPMTETPSIALGTSEVSLLELTGAYVPFANDGYGVIPHVVTRITTADGDVLYERSGSGPGRVVDPLYVGMMNSMLKQTLEIGTGRKAAIANWPAAGKTGTSQDFRDAWFVGYTAPLIAGIWFGNDDGKPTKKLTGGSLPAATWQRFMELALDGVPVVDLPGNYQVREPAYVADAPGYLAPVRSIGALLNRSGFFADAAPPAPPGAVGAYEPERPKRRGFLKRLFGG